LNTTALKYWRLCR